MRRDSGPLARRWKPLSAAELDRQITAARRKSSVASAAEPRAAHARYDHRTGRIEVELTDGWMFAFPVAATQGLRGASREHLANVEIAGDGYALHWEDRDAHFTVSGLLAGRLGSRVWMREHARTAGSVRSKAKARAARRKGRKGGRPRSTVA